MSITSIALALLSPFLACALLTTCHLCPGYSERDGIGEPSLLGSLLEANDVNGGSTEYENILKGVSTIAYAAGANTTVSSITTFFYATSGNRPNPHRPPFMLGSIQTTIDCDNTTDSPHNFIKLSSINFNGPLYASGHWGGGGLGVTLAGCRVKAWGCGGWVVPIARAARREGGGDGRSEVAQQWWGRWRASSNVVEGGQTASAEEHASAQETG
ncbi:hypothetical protein BD779DRAFT_1480435 [Infundibulicybe gibba]|nr:hypothetical protein BD779DRAFT_1480435 [Infundibulicybe gibba]